ncbi:putative ubiquinone biosynthesis protein [Aulographum hederae CBS 113979]|uniref:Putative ubiquinone biosynthesis protein n=1 Tax=Aulographum hederae CBS 113979 TaxID=1176131 RepID=A0A6G1H1V1_9PEZI|nr:putative ubiquinone biosynthesis protein [Aulographum hederae CBS 113979]
MRPVLLLSRQCVRQAFRLPFGSGAAPRQCCSRLFSSTTTRVLFRPQVFPRTKFGNERVWSRGKNILIATLSPAAFVLLSEQDDESGETGEDRMLQASRKEIDEHVPQILEGSNKWRIGLYHCFDAWIWEPICTGLRFLHLVVIFVPVIVTIPVIWIGKRQKDKDDERTGTIWWYGFLVASMERAGAAFIKLGQWAASRTDIFPTEMCIIMSSLHSHAPAHSLAKTKKIVEKAFGGRKFEDIFEEFQEKPLGVGAIAQVYKAKLKPDLAAPGQTAGDEPENLSERVMKNVNVAIKSTPARVPSTYVAIKVLHPKVERIVRRDLRIMGFFASIINAIPTMEWLSFPDEVAQFGEMMRLQLDLRIESANLSIFRKNFKSRTTAWFPYPYSDYTTRQVLVEEFATGIPLEHFLENGGGVFQKEIADEGLDAFLHMVLIDNFIHADLHPGNIMVRFYKPHQLDVPRIEWKKSKDMKKIDNSVDVTEEVLQRLRPFKKKPKEWKDQLKKLDDEGYRPQLIFIDTGLVTELNELNRKNFLDLFKAVAEFDGYKAGHLMVERCRQPDAVIDKEVFALRMQHLVLGVKSRTFALGNIKIGDILNEVLSMVRGHHVRLEGDFVNVVLSILLLEGIGRSLNPEMDLFAGALPILRQLGTQSGSSMLRSGDFSMVKVWVGLEARSLFRASIESVENCVKYDLLSPNV